MTVVDVDALAATVRRRSDGARLCSLSFCDGAYFCRGMCNRHHQQWKRTGSPFTSGLKGGRPKASKVPGWLDLDRLARTSALDGWHLYGRCRPERGDRFFVDAHQTQKTQKTIREVCDGCPVRYACLAHQLERVPSTHLDFGVWGGTSVNERRRIRRALTERRAA